MLIATHRLIKISLTVFLTVWVGVAAARQGVPVVDFVDVPVGAATEKPVTALQVRAAIIAAALINRWDVENDGDALRLTLVENHAHTAVVRVAYSASAYSVLYLDSKDLEYLAADRTFTPYMVPGAFEEATKKQRERFARYSESKSAVARPGTFIHPFYEEWVIDLLRGVRRQLMVPQ